MKKIIFSLLISMVALSLFACGKNEVAEAESGKETTVLKTEASKEKEKLIKISDNGETLTFGSVELEIADIEKKAKELEEKLENATSQLDMNEISNELYKLWDKELNDLRKRIKEKYDGASMKILNSDELAWIKDKEKKIKEAGAKFEGGSIQALEENMTGAGITRERVYILANILAQILGEPVVMPSVNQAVSSGGDVKELNMKGNFYSQCVACNINEGIQWKYEIANGCMKLDDEIDNFADFNSKTEIGDIVYSFRGEKEGDDSITWTLVDTKDNKCYFTVKFDFHVDGKKDKDGFLPFTLIKQTANDNRPVSLAEYRFDEPEVTNHGAGNG